MTIRLALVVYFSLWLAWLVSGYVRQYHGRHPGEAISDGPGRRRLMHLVVWAALVVGIAAAWRALHPGS